MKNKFSILIFCVSAVYLFSYCSDNNSETREKEDCSTAEVFDDSIVYYFKFDEVDHYSIDVDINEVEYFDSLNPNRDELLNLLEDKAPTNLDDSSFILKMVKVGFLKNKIPISKNMQINELFREKSFDPCFAEWMCMPVYRDILIFKKHAAIIGIAKVCFECDQISIAGTEAETKYFGSFQGFERLHKLLYGK